MAREAWRLWDDRLSEEFVFSVNPSSDGGSFGVVRPVAYKSVCASYRDSLGVDRVGTVVFAKPDEQERFSFNGSVIFEGQRDDMLGWFSKGYPLVLTDDLGRQFSVFTESFDLKRVRSRQFPFKCNYSWTGLVLGRIV